MDNLQPYQEIEDRTGQTVFRVYSHKQLSEADLNRVILKKSLWEPGGKTTRYNRPYDLVNIIAADGWEDAE
jgi:hypothetical protein